MSEETAAGIETPAAHISNYPTDQDSPAETAPLPDEKTLAKLRAAWWGLR